MKDIKGSCHCSGTIKYSFKKIDMELDHKQNCYNGRVMLSTKQRQHGHFIFSLYAPKLCIYVRHVSPCKEEEQ